MRSGDFDTYLSIGQVVDGRYQEVEKNDDADGWYLATNMRS